MAEINTFLHQVSYDVETFITRYKIEHTTLSERLLKLSEDVQGLVNNVLDNQTGLSQHSTILTCLVEFNGMEQALSTQDEADKSQMKLMAGGKDLKIPELDLASDATNVRAGRNMSNLTSG